MIIYDIIVYHMIGGQGARALLHSGLSEIRRNRHCVRVVRVVCVCVCTHTHTHMRICMYAMRIIQLSGIYLQTFGSHRSG